MKTTFGLTHRDSIEVRKKDDFVDCWGYKGVCGRWRSHKSKMCATGESYLSPFGGGDECKGENMRTYTVLTDCMHLSQYLTYTEFPSRKVGDADSTQEIHFLLEP